MHNRKIVEQFGVQIGIFRAVTLVVLWNLGGCTLLQVPTYKTTQCLNTEDHILNNHCLKHLNEMLQLSIYIKYSMAVVERR
jgi:hypothetical protein